MKLSHMAGPTAAGSKFNLAVRAHGYLPTYLPDRNTAGNLQTVWYKNETENEMENCAQETGI